MYNDDDAEYILDSFVRKETMVNKDSPKFWPLYEVDTDDSTLSASESGEKPKKLRVLVKKLPQDVIDYYFTKKDFNSSSTTSRLSTRVKTVPAKYRFLQKSSSIKEPSNNSNQTGTQEKKSIGISKNSVIISKMKTVKNVIVSKPNKSPNQPQTETNKNVPQTKTNKNAPQTKTNVNTPVIVGPSKILVIKQPVLKNDPLDIPQNLERKVNKNIKKNSNKDGETEFESETETETETEDIQQPEVIKRIYFESKASQTKFTCDGSICGLVDSNLFNLNCFYCYEIFPLHKWWDFKKHIKLQHEMKSRTAKKPAITSLVKTKEANIFTETSAYEKELMKIRLPVVKDKQIQISPKDSTNNSSSKLLELNKIKILEKDSTNNSLSKSPEFNKVQVLKITDLNKKSTTNGDNIKYISVKIPPQKHTTVIVDANHSKYKEIGRVSLQKSPVTTTTNQLNQTDDFIDLTSNDRKRPAPDISNFSCADDIISLGDDDNEEDEFDEIIDSFEKELQEKNLKITSTVNAGSQSKLPTLKNSNINVSPLNPNKKTSTTQDTNKFISSISKASSPPNQKCVTFKSASFNISSTGPNNTAQMLSSQLPHLTIKKIDKTALSKAINTAASSSEAMHIPSTMKKAYIKLPSNLSIEEVLKTIPQAAISQKNSTSDGSKKPRYFVVKKVIKQPVATDNEPKIDLPAETVMDKISTLKENDYEDDMPSNDENEDEVPKPTNGCGILFGLTNRNVVIEFLLKLKTYPELWRPTLKNDANINYDDSIQEMCVYLNDRFDLNIQDFEMRLSIQRVKDWYCLILKNIYVHNQNRTSIEPYKHAFPEYFKILNQFLTSDVHFTKNLLLGKRFKPMNTIMQDYPKWMVYKPGRPAHKVAKIHLEGKSQKGPSIKYKPTTLPDEDASQNVIEFDADALYGDESSDDENLKPPPPPKKPRKPRQVYYKPNSEIPKFTKPKGTKRYCPLVPIVCDMCNKNFKRNLDLRRHRVSHFPPQFQCSVCSQKFFQKHWAEKCNHLRKKRKYYFSDEESKDGTTKDETIKIKSTNPNILPFRKWMCEMCGVSYRSVGSLNHHKRDKHLNQRLKCIVCKFTAITNYRIVQHQKKRHVVEPGTVEEVAKKCRARMDSKTPFTPEARREFDWRREMRKKLKPGELFYGCCKCQIIFKTRKEKCLHNKLEHPIKETTVVCLMCLPDKMLLSNSNSVRRHYTDIHKVPWDEIDDLVKRTKPVFHFLSKDEIELLNASDNCTELLSGLLSKRNMCLDPIKEESSISHDNLPNKFNMIEVEKEEIKQQEPVNDDFKNNHKDEEEEEQVYVDGIIDHDYNHEDNNSEFNNEHNYKNDHDYNNDHNNDNQKHHEENEINNDGNHYTDNTADHVIVTDDNQSAAYYNTEDGNQVDCADQNQSAEYQHEDFSNEGYTIQYEGEIVEGELVEESIVVEELVEEDFIEEDIIEEFF